MADKTITILGESVPVSSDRVDIFSLKFLKENPRVYTVTHGQPCFTSKTQDEQQAEIFQALKKEPSVRNLQEDIKRHGGLLEPILVRLDTMEVIEGNSRLAVYRLLHEDDGKGQWAEIDCDMVSSLTDEQQAAYLNQIHIKGKTKWTAYEKANFAYVRHGKGQSYRAMAKLFGESQQTMRTRVKVIDAMRENDDGEQSNFSYYDVIVRNSAINSTMDGDEEFCTWIRDSIRRKEKPFSAQEMRKKLPVILKKKKILRKLVRDDLELDDAYSRASISKAQKALQSAKGILEDISDGQVRELDRGEFNAFEYDLRKLRQALSRIEKMAKLRKSG